MSNDQFQTLIERLDNIDSNIENIRSDIGSIKLDIKNINSDIESIRIYLDLERSGHTNRVMPYKDSHIDYEEVFKSKGV